MEPERVPYVTVVKCGAADDADAMGRLVVALCNLTRTPLAKMYKFESNPGQWRLHLELLIPNVPAEEYNATFGSELYGGDPNIDSIPVGVK